MSPVWSSAPLAPPGSLAPSATPLALGGGPGSLLAALVGLLVVGYVLSRATVTLAGHERAVYAVRGASRGVLESGVTLVVPFVTEVTRFDRRVRTVEVDVAVTTADGERVDVDATASFRVTDVEAAYREVVRPRRTGRRDDADAAGVGDPGGPADAAGDGAAGDDEAGAADAADAADATDGDDAVADAVAAAASGALRTHLSGTTLADLRAPERERRREVDVGVRDDLAARVDGWGVAVDDVELVDVRGG